MNPIARTRICLPIAGMILTVALALPAAAQQQVPFKGTFQGNDDASKPPTVIQSVMGVGTLVGQFSSITILTVTPSGGTGTATWTAANGDTINTTVAGALVPASMASCQVADG